MKNHRFHNRLAEKVANRLQAREFVSSDLPFRPSVPKGGFCSGERPAGKAHDDLKLKGESRPPEIFERSGRIWPFLLVEPTSRMGVL